MNPFFIAFLVMPLPVYALLRPTTSARWRYAALIGMLLLGWALLVMLEMYDHHMRWYEYELCKKQPAFNAEQCMGILNIAGGAAYAFKAVFGWLFTAMYIGGWELTWRAIFWLHSRNSLHTLHAWWLGNVCIVLFFIAMVFYCIWRVERFMKHM